VFGAEREREREREDGGSETERAEAVHRHMQVQSLTPSQPISFLLQGLSSQVSLSSHFSSLSLNPRSLTLSFCCSLGARIPPQPKTVRFHHYLIYAFLSCSYFHNRMQEPGDFDEKKPDPPLSAQDDLVESDIELDDADVVEPDNDPPQKVSYLLYVCAVDSLQCLPRLNNSIVFYCRWEILLLR